jgi:hypothetical protein
MSYKLEKPLSIEERANFIVDYNHNQSLRIEETELAIYALEEWEELVGDEVIDNKEAWEEKQAQKEKERIAQLSLTKREVFLGLYQAKGVTPDMIKAQITDPQALIEFEYANDYYRGNPLIDIVGATLGITPEQLDKFFETNDYTVLLPAEEPTVSEMEIVEDITGEEIVNNEN